MLLVSGDEELDGRGPSVVDDDSKGVLLDEVGPSVPGGDSGDVILVAVDEEVDVLEPPLVDNDCEDVLLIVGC